VLNSLRTDPEIKAAVHDLIEEHYMRKCWAAAGQGDVEGMMEAKRHQMSIQWLMTELQDIADG